jgi:hypothetical protein
VQRLTSGALPLGCLGYLRCGDSSVFAGDVLFLRLRSTQREVASAVLAKRLYRREGFKEIGEVEVTPGLWVTRFSRRL